MVAHQQLMLPIKNKCRQVCNENNTNVTKNNSLLQIAANVLTNLHAF